MEWTYKLKEESGFKGFIKIELPSVKEQFKILKELTLTPNQEGKIEFANQVDAIEKQLELCEKYVVEVNIEHVSSKKKFSAVDEMLYFKQTRELLLSDICGFLINGIDLGKL